MKTEKKEQKRVKCADCRHSERDTEGISFSTTDGHFFMGTCHRGHGNGPKHKVFMDDEVTICEDFDKR